VPRERLGDKIEHEIRPRHPQPDERDDGIEVPLIKTPNISASPLASNSASDRPTLITDHYGQARVCDRCVQAAAHATRGRP